MTKTLRLEVIRRQTYDGGYHSIGIHRDTGTWFTMDELTRIISEYSCKIKPNPNAMDINVKSFYLDFEFEDHMYCAFVISEL